EAQRVTNLARFKNFIIAHEAGKNRQASGVGRGPAIRPHCTRFQIKNGSALRVPTAVALRKRTEHFIQFPVVSIDDDHMTIAVSVRAAFDWSVAWDWIRTRIAFGAVRREVDRNAWLRSRHDDIGNAVRHTAIDGSKIRMQHRIDTDAGDQSRRVRIDRRVRDVLIPRIVRRKKSRAMKTRSWP